MRPSVHFRDTNIFDYIWKQSSINMTWNIFNYMKQKQAMSLNLDVYTGVHPTGKEHNSYSMLQSESVSQ